MPTSAYLPITFDDSERGFSFRFDGALDMRMNKRAGLTAADIVNTYEEEKLADIFYLYGELKNSRKLASVIVKARATQRIATIGEFFGNRQATLRPRT